VQRREFITLLAAGLVGGLAGPAETTPPTGKPAPEFTLTLLDGRTVPLKSFRGKPVVVNFWGSG
jgi:cytochrome oxidase Cu insertion factor (SCO1/SenC/PrrC family)